MHRSESVEDPMELDGENDNNSSPAVDPNEDVDDIVENMLPAVSDQGHLLGGDRTSASYTCFGCGALMTSTEFDIVSLAEVEAMLEFVIHAHGTNMPNPVHLINLLCKNVFMRHSDFDLGPTIAAMETAISGIITSAGLLDKRDKDRKMETVSSHDVDSSYSLVSASRRLLTTIKHQLMEESSHNNSDKILERIKAVIKLVKTNFHDWATTINTDDENEDSCGIYCHPPVRKSKKGPGFRGANKADPTSCFRKCKQGSQCPLHVGTTTISSNGNGSSSRRTETVDKGTQTSDFINTSPELFDEATILRRIRTFSPDKAYLSKSPYCVACKVRYTKDSIIAEQPIGQSVLIGLGFSFLRGLCSSVPASLVVLEEDVDICVLCVHKSLSKVHAMVQTLQNSSLLCRYRILVLTGPPPLVVFDPAAPPTRVTSNLKRDNSLLLYEMKIFICEECIKHGFLDLEELHFEFCDRLGEKN